MRSSQDTYTLANGVKMPCIGLGTYQSPDAVASAAVKDAMAAGYRLIDTAAAYGNERGVGQGIRISGVPREEIFVTSKLRNAAHGYQATLEAFDMTLSRLGLRYLDLYLIHWPNPIQYRTTWQEATIGTWKAFEELYKAGRIRAIGVSKVPQMQQLAQKYGRSVGQICLRWSMQMGWLPLPKSANPDRVKENLNVFDFELEPEDVELIANLKGVCGEAPVPDEIHF